MPAWSKKWDGYLAGLFDGEGCVLCAVYPTKGTAGGTQVRVNVNMTDRAPLLLFHLRFPGGSILRRVRNYPDAKRKPIHTWQIGGKKARPILEFVAKHCVVKKGQAVLALEILALLSERDGGPQKGFLKVKISPENMAARLTIAKRISELKDIPVDDALGLTI